MNKAYSDFLQLIEDIEKTEILYDYMTNVAKIPMDCSDLLRWEWTQCVSAFDKLIHDLVLKGMMQSFDGKRTKTDHFKEFKLDYTTCEQMMSSKTPELCFQSFVITRLAVNTYQSPEKIAEGLALIWGEKHKWEVISKEAKLSTNYCVTMMKNIVLRRNQIVHQGDYVDSTASMRQDILFSDVIQVKDFIKQIANAIYNLVNR